MVVVGFTDMIYIYIYISITNLQMANFFFKQLHTVNVNLTASLLPDIGE